MEYIEWKGEVLSKSTFKMLIKKKFSISNENLSFLQLIIYLMFLFENYYVPNSKFNCLVFQLLKLFLLRTIGSP